MKQAASAALAAAWFVVAGSSASAGPTWELGEDASMKLSFLGQVHASYNDDAADKEDIYLRRARFILSGQIKDGLKFFVETDSPNAGRNGAPDAEVDIQDAFLDVQLGSSNHWIELGLILLPFSFESRASAASLLGLDYNSETIKLVNSFVWRDYGAELHGHLAGKRASYCLGVFDGYDSRTGSKSDSAGFRYTGHLALNLRGEAETGWFYGQSRLGKAGTYLSLGVGFDVQDDATLVPGPEPEPGEEPSEPTVVDSEAWVLDFQSGFSVGKVGLTMNGAWHDWDSAGFEGNTAFLETGALVGKLMVTGKYSLQDRDGSATVDDYTVGLHYFAKGHGARGGVEYRWGDSDEQVLVGIQFLL